MNLKYIIFISLMLISSQSLAQSFKKEAELDSVPAKGFYKILIPPQIISVANLDYGDIRLLDSEDQEIPYLLESEQPVSAINGFKEYPLVENQYIKEKKITRVVLQNKGRMIISNLNVIIRNAQINKAYTLKGSDNQKDWFIIQKGNWEQLSSFNATSQRLELFFPKIDYEFLELSINDTNNDPVQIQSMGYFDSHTIWGQYSEIPVKFFQQIDSTDHKTYLKIQFDHTYEISRLDFKISGADFYQRDCFIGTFTNEKQQNLFKETAFFQLSSNTTNSVTANNPKLDHLVVIIENKDNQPLHVDGIHTFQLNKYLIANLEPEKTYRITAGNHKLQVPEYDLRFFTNSIPRDLPLLKGHMVDKSLKSVLIKPNLLNTQTFLWIVILVVIVVVGFFSIRMIKELGNKRKEIN